MNNNTKSDERYVSQYMSNIIDNMFKYKFIIFGIVVGAVIFSSDNITLEVFNFDVASIDYTTLLPIIIAIIFIFYIISRVNNRERSDLPILP